MHLSSQCIRPALLQLAMQGLDDFYQGDLAHSIAGDLERVGSPLRLSDLQSHQAAWKTPLALTHTLGTVYNMPPPTQGLVSLLILGQLDRLLEDGMDPLGAPFVHACVEATKQAFAIRDRDITDPAYMSIDPQQLLAADRLDEMAAHVRPGMAGAWAGGKGPGDTVWMGVIDANGVAVSFIQSIYHEFGSGVVAGDTGVLWQNRGVSFSLQAGALNALDPCRKPFHTLNPPMAQLKDGRTVVYGSMGGDGQPQFQATVFTRHLVFGDSVQDAVSAPRWLLGRTWGSASETLKLESRFAPEVFEQLAARGHAVESLGAFDDSAGHAGLIVRHPDGRLEGAADPRSDGAVAHA
mgnify:CR=1 FL=1